MSQEPHNPDREIADSAADAAWSISQNVARIATALEMIAERLAKAQELVATTGPVYGGATCGMCGKAWPVGDNHVCGGEKS